MTENNEGVTLTIKARDLAELKEKLITQLTELGVEIPTKETKEEVETDFPAEIKEIYPDYEYNYHSAAMLTVLHENHKGRNRKVSSWELAKEMKGRFPEFFSRDAVKRISWGNIFPGSQLEKQGLLHIEMEDKRYYWVE